VRPGLLPAQEHGAVWLRQAHALASWEALVRHGLLPAQEHGVVWLRQTHAFASKEALVRFGSYPHRSTVRFAEADALSRGGIFKGRPFAGRLGARDLA